MRIKMSNENNEQTVVDYEDDRIKSYDAKIPKFLIFSYIVVPIWGIVTFIIFWNGSVGWFDRGAWQQLQVAANTTFPTENHNEPLEEPKIID